jgi:hypothetical protein
MLCISLQRFAQHDSAIISRHSRSGNQGLHAAREANNGKRQQKATKITKHSVSSTKSFLPHLRFLLFRVPKWIFVFFVAFCKIYLHRSPRDKLRKLSALRLSYQLLTISYLSAVADYSAAAAAKAASAKADQPFPNSWPWRGSRARPGRRCWSRWVCWGRC